uniref:Putative secreted protein n=1 Tax=Anopheles darlingi TaxID=43151 RepID=A0A2M4DPW3_ANODA
MVAVREVLLFLLPPTNAPVAPVTSRRTRDTHLWWYLRAYTDLPNVNEKPLSTVGFVWMEEAECLTTSTTTTIRVHLRMF